jgi:N-acetylmuramate 1-kinase
LCDEERILDGTIRYWESAKKANLPVPADFGDFYRDAEWMGLQRHLKLLGALAPSGEQATSKQMAEIPRLIRYVRQVGERYVALFPLIRLFDKLNINDGVPRTVGISF